MDSNVDCDIYDYDEPSEPWMLYDGLAIAEDRGRATDIALIGQYAMALQERLGNDDYQEIWETADRILISMHGL